MDTDDYRARLPSSTGDPVQDAVDWAAIAFRGSVEAIALVRALELEVERLSGRVTILEQRQPSSPPGAVVAKSPNGWLVRGPAWAAVWVLLLVNLGLLLWVSRPLWAK